MDRRVREAVVIRFAWVMSGAGVVWGLLYVLLGVTSASVYPFGFAVLTTANGLLYRASRRFQVFAWVEIVLILVVPFVLNLHLGGFVPSGAVILWSSLAPLGAMLVLGRRAAVLTFAGFIIAAALSVIVQSSASVMLPALAIEGFAFLNVVAVSGVAVAAARTFVTTNAELARQQQKVRELEQAYLSQELLMRQQERLATLGRLSAGVAHELNNPAAAAGRATDRLTTALDRIGKSPARLLEVEVDAIALDRLRKAVCGEAPADPLERSDRADTLGRWLEGRSVSEAWELADTLVDAGVEAHALARAAEGLAPAQLEAALCWIADTEQTRRLLGDVRRSANRISEIVRALKGYSHMDRASVQRVDVVAGLEDTLIILKGKLEDITIRREYETNLPEIQGNAGELNQAWTNIIANAAEAQNGTGAITLRVSREEGCVQIEIEDDGPGIPADLVDRVFDPFVTTKPPGEGTGLGLNLVHRTITEQHRGTIEVRSKPGCTRFIVRLPVHQEAEDG